MSISRIRVDKTVEIVCHRGCEYVRKVIADLDYDNTADIPEMREMRLQQDRFAVLTELKEIMSVYDEGSGGSCPIPVPRRAQEVRKKSSQ